MSAAVLVLLVWVVSAALLLGPFREALNPPAGWEDRLARDNPDVAVGGRIPPRILSGLLLAVRCLIVLLAPIFLAALAYHGVRLKLARRRLKRARTRVMRCECAWCRETKALECVRAD